MEVPFNVKLSPKLTDLSVEYFVPIKATIEFVSPELKVLPEDNVKVPPPIKMMGWPGSSP